LNACFREKWLAPGGWKPVYTTVRYLVIQSIALQKPFMAFGNVPIPVSHPREDRSFMLPSENQESDLGNGTIITSR
jgi:hypothetical protein